jgi:transglutaminase-like putative cysteine protease
VHFAIRFLTEYDYDAEVVDNLNALRVKPHQNGRQRCDDFAVRLTPEVRLHRHTDYFGTEVVEFEVSRPHTHLTIDVRARVSTSAAPEPPSSTWEALRRPGYREAGGEFLLQTDDAAGDPLLDELIAATGAPASPLDAVLLVSTLIPDRLEYRRGATYVDSTIADLLQSRAGVCQDFVHLGLNLLRHHGIAARYVSGYLYASGSDDAAAAGAPHESVEVDTHAWLEALLPRGEDPGEDPVWVGVDPTNRGLAGETHVKVGHGRHYADVPPIKGVYRGAASARLRASVTMTRLQRTDPASIARS